MKIRKLKKEDLKTRVEWMNNPKVYESMHFAIPVVMENTLNWYMNNLGNSHRADVVFEDHNEIVAFGGITGIDDETKRGELYIFVNPTSQSKGIGTEASRLLCEYGYKELKLNKIYLETNEDNYPAQKVYEKVGFRLEGRLRKEYRTKTGELKDRLYYGMLKEDFKG